MSQITVTINGKTGTISREVAQRQLEKSEAWIAARVPIAQQAHNRHSSVEECALAQAGQDERIALHAGIIAALRAALAQ